MLELVGKDPGVEEISFSRTAGSFVILWTSGNDRFLCVETLSLTRFGTCTLRLLSLSLQLSLSLLSVFFHRYQDLTM